MSTGTPGNPAARRRGCRIRRWLGLLLVSLLVGCFLLTALLLVQDRLLPPTPAAVLRADLAIRLAEAEQVWADLDDLWGRLAGGATLSCQQEAVSRPYFVAWRTMDRVTYPPVAALADQLNGGLRRLHEAADAWEASCRSSTADLSPAQVAAVRQSLDQARLILDAVSAALTETP